MTTAPLSDDERHRRAASFERAADVYEANRPEYPQAALDFAVPSTARTVLDLGAGTGKLTRALAARGFEVTAIDPSPAMLAQLHAVAPDVRTVVAAAEATREPDAAFDAVTVASAFHWFDRPAADAEIARVLKPGGTAALLWNRRDPDSPLARAFDHAARRTGPSSRAHGDGVELDELWFGPTERAEFPHTVAVTAERLVGMVASRSYVIEQDDAERTALLDRVAAFARDELGLVGDATVDLPMRAVVLRASRR